MKEKPFALISVYDKTGLEPLARALLPKYRILSTGGTGVFLANHGIPYLDVSTYTGSPELFHGRVKTLHPLIHGGILFKKEQENEAKDHGVQPIDLVVVNLYPFEKIVMERGSPREILEEIDIGGPTLLRAAAKNYHRVIVLSSPSQYQEFITRLHNSTLTESYRKTLALQAFTRVTDYDLWIERYFQNIESSLARPRIVPRTSLTLRYGENLHQKAKYITEYNDSPFLEQLHGKKVSLNNFLDFYTGVRVINEFSTPTVVLVKHTSPCGVATHSSLEKAWLLARDSDPIGAFGSAMVFNRKLTYDVALHMSKMFVDTVLAPDYTSEAFELLSKKKNIVLCKLTNSRLPDYELFSVPGGTLVQERDTGIPQKNELQVLVGNQLSDELYEQLLFAWKVVKHVKSNAAVLARDNHTVGIGAGLSSRIAVVKYAIQQAGEKAKGAVLATDGFFPYRDSIDEAAKAGVKAIINPIGSIRDKETINAAKEHGLTFVASPYRSFRH